MDTPFSIESPVPLPLRPGEVAPDFLTYCRSKPVLGRRPLAKLLQRPVARVSADIRAGRFGSVVEMKNDKGRRANRYEVGLRVPYYSCLSEDQLVMAGHHVDGLEESVEGMGMRLCWYTSLSMAVVHAVRTACFPIFLVNNQTVSRSELIDVADLLRSRCPKIEFLFLAPDRTRAGGGVEVSGWKPLDVDLLEVSLRGVYDDFVHKKRMGPLKPPTFPLPIV